MLDRLDRKNQRTISLSAKDVENWARFSGDWNAIHFDAKAANALRVPAPFAHGMLALLPVKQAAHNVLSDANVEWLSVDNRLRMPVFLDELLDLKTDRDARSASVEMCNRDGQVLISCVARQEQPSTMDPVPKDRKTPVTQTDIQAFADFDAHPLLNGGPAIWIMLEAIAFRHFLNAVDGEKLGESIAEIAGIRPSAKTTTPLVMQTRNTVSADITATADPTASGDFWTSFSINSKDLGKDAHFVQVTVVAGQAERLILSSVESMTLKYSNLGGSNE